MEDGQLSASLLIYSLHSHGDFDYGNTDIRLIAEYLETVLMWIWETFTIPISK